ncbi:MAG TPA: VOC family protein [Bryobacteraceae bacterium]|nr:VOC family protein [Bryobacteraceae bacterium]
MDMKLEVVVLPVSDVERSKRFYENLGFRLDVDVAPNENYRAVHLTPPGSQTSIVFGKGVTSAQPGSVDRLLLAVYDIDAARQELLTKGIDVSDIFHDAGGSLGAGFIAAAEAHAPGPDPQSRSYASYACFSDPDGNVWLLQEIRERLPGRVTRASLDGEATGILLKALRSAAVAYGGKEQETATANGDWPAWYAEHMTRTLSAAGYHLTGPSAS